MPTADKVFPELMPAKSLTHIVAQKHVIYVEEDDSEAQYYIDMYQRQLNLYAKPLIGLPVFESTTGFNPGSAKVQEAPKRLSAQSTSVCKWSTNDCMNLFPDAREVFNENIDKFNVVQALSSPSMKFRCVFNPKVIIDCTTYKFISQVFGFPNGRKA